MKIGIISDIHEDIQRLNQAIALLRSHECEKIICLGDLVGYSVPYFGFLASRNAPEVVKLVKSNCDIIVAGNHDLFAIKKLPIHKAAFDYPSNWYSLDYLERKRLSDGLIWLYENTELPALLTKQDMDFIDSLPEYAVVEFDNINVLLSHYAYPDLVGATKTEIKSVADLQEHFKFMETLNCNIGISGHDHTEGIMRFTPDSVEEFPFGKVGIDKNIPTWVLVPGVVNGSYANGVTVFNTMTFEAETIPLNSGKHILPDWRNK